MRTVLCLFVVAIAALAGCERVPAPAPESAAGPPTIYTTFYPTTYFARRIAGDNFEVICPVPPDADPIFWQPPREAIAAYQQAGAIIINGAGFEKWVQTAALPQSRVIDSAADIPGGFIEYESTTHSHGAGGEHTHEGIDGHTWLDPRAAIAQAEAIRDGLSRLFPQDAETFERGFDALRRDLEALDARFTALTPALQGAQLLASHPAYNYLARRYGWEITNFDFDPEAPISDDAFAEIAADPQARAVILLWESEPLPEMRARLSSELNITSIVFSPCELLDPARIAAGEDYLTVMNDNVARLAAAAGE